MAFDGLLGQNEIKARLSENVSSEHVGHAYLFTAPEGGGKKSFATEFAKMCMCLNPEMDGTRCGKCRACVLNDSNTNPDIIWVRPESDKKSILVDQVRSEIEEAVITAPAFSKKKIFIIDGAEKMNEQAQNALLKTLEEPPEYVTILLLTSNAYSMLDTIRSRVVRVDMKRNTDAEVLEAVDRISQKPGINKDLLCAYSDGIIGRALEFVQNDENAGMRRNLVKLLSPLFKRDAFARIDAQKLIDVKNKKYDFFFFQFTSFVRDAMVMARLGNKTKIMNQDFKSELESLYREVGYYRLKNAIAAANECYKKLSQNAAQELAIEDMLLKISK